MIHPMQYDLERAYHSYRQRAAARQRLVAEAERQIADASRSDSLAYGIRSQLHAAFVRGVRALALPRRQVA